MTLVLGTVVAQVTVFFMMMLITRLYAPEVMGEFGAFTPVTAIIVSVVAGALAYTDSIRSAVAGIWLFRESDRSMDAGFGS